MNNDELRHAAYGEFKFAIPIEKSYSTTDGDETKMFIAGLASGVNVDHDSDQMSPSAIAAFQKAVTEGMLLHDGTHSMIPLRTGHRKEWSDIIGWVTKASVDEEHNLWIEAELDETSSIARDLFAKLQKGSRPGKPLQLGFSVGGFITKARNEWDSLAKKSKRIIEGVFLDEISVVGRPAYAPSFFDLMEKMEKSVRWEDVPTFTKEQNMPENVDDVKSADNAQSDNVQQSESTTSESESPAPENEAPNASDASEAAAEVAGAPAETQDTNTDNANVGNDVSNPSEELLKSLQDDVNALKDAVTALLAAQQSTNSQPETPEVIEKAADTSATPEALEKSTKDFVVDAVSAALIAFKDEHLTPLVADLENVKGTVAEMATEPLDKSISVEAATDVQVDYVEEFRKRFSNAAARQNAAPSNPIRHAVEASLARQ